MGNHKADLLKILHIAHEISMLGAGISLQDALARTRYAQLRVDHGPEDLIPLIRADRAVIDQWIMYSENKRTSGGWYIHSNGELGRLSEPGSSIQLDSLERAVAEYIVRELDYWASIP